MGEAKVHSEEETSQEDGRPECKFEKIEDAYETTVAFYRTISTPATVEEVFTDLRSDFHEFKDCACPVCMIRTAQCCETFVVISEVLKMIPKDCEKGVVGLIYRLHLSRMEAVKAELVAQAGKALKVVVSGEGLLDFMTKSAEASEEPKDADASDAGD